MPTAKSQSVASYSATDGIRRFVHIEVQIVFIAANALPAADFIFSSGGELSCSCLQYCLTSRRRTNIAVPTGF